MYFPVCANTGCFPGTLLQESPLTAIGRAAGHREDGSVHSCTWFCTNSTVKVNNEHRGCVPASSISALTLQRFAVLTAFLGIVSVRPAWLLFLQPV